MTAEVEVQLNGLERFEKAALVVAEATQALLVAICELKEAAVAIDATVKQKEPLAAHQREGRPCGRCMRFDCPGC